MPDKEGSRLINEFCNNCKFYLAETATIMGITYPGQCTKRPRLHQKHNDGTGPDLWCMNWEVMTMTKKTTTEVEPMKLTPEDTVEDAEQVDTASTSRRRYSDPITDEKAARRDEAEAMLKGLLELQAKFRGGGVAAMEGNDRLATAESVGALQTVKLIIESVQRRLTELQ